MRDKLLDAEHLCLSHPFHVQDDLNGNDILKISPSHARLRANLFHFTCSIIRRFPTFQIFSPDDGLNFAKR